jgi:hypothetical protein
MKKIILILVCLIFFNCFLFSNTTVNTHGYTFLGFNPLRWMNKMAIAITNRAGGGELRLYAALTRKYISINKLVFDLNFINIDPEKYGEVNNYCLNKYFDGKKRIEIDNSKFKNQICTKILDQKKVFYYKIQKYGWTIFN